MKKVKINLVGLNGNAFSLIGTWSEEAKKQGFDEDQIKEVVNDATSRDYDHLLRTLIAHSK